MASNPPTYSPEYSDKKLSIKESTIIKFENRAALSGIKVATLMKSVLDEAVKDDPWTAADEKKLHERILKNIERNDRTKARYSQKN